MVINRAKFDACTSSRFGGVKTGTQIDRIALHLLDYDVIIASVDRVWLRTKFHSSKLKVIKQCDDLVSIFRDFKDNFITCSYSNRIELQMFEK